MIDTNTPHELTDGGFAARRAASEACADALGLRFLRDALPEDLSCAGMDARAAKAWRADLVDSSVNRALDALEDAGRPCSFPRGWVRHAFHDMTLVGRASYLLQHADELGLRRLRRRAAFSRSRLYRCVMSCVFLALEIDDAVQVCRGSGRVGCPYWWVVVWWRGDGADSDLSAGGCRGCGGDCVCCARLCGASFFCRWLLVLRRLMIGLRALILRIFRCCRVGR